MSEAPPVSMEQAFADAIESAIRERSSSASDSPSTLGFAEPTRTVASRPSSIRRTRTEAELRDELKAALLEVRPERKLLATLHRSNTTDGQRHAILEEQENLRGLPFRMGAECRSDLDAAQVLAALSRDYQSWRNRKVVRQRVRNVTPLDGKATTNMTAAATASEDELSPDERRAVAVEAMLEQGHWLSPESVPAIEQMLQVEETPARIEMVAGLARFKTEQATVALARRALFDVSPEVRAAALSALRNRPREEYIDNLLSGFRHPWEQAAWNAAEALIALKVRDVDFELVCLLDQPAPTAAYVNDEGNWSVRELVAVNHLRNCQLCHSRSSGNVDVVRGPVPTPGQRLPVQYYQSTVGEFVRADVTYLKQDFSLMHPVKNAAPWPEMQRFDYLVRERELSALELPLYPTSSGDVPAPAYPQRDAVLLALRELTGTDAGTTSDAWRGELFFIESELVGVPR